MNMIAVLILGAVGGVLRLPLEQLGLIGVIIANCIGSLILGFLHVLLTRKRLVQWLQDGVMFGLIGSFTSFSALIGDAQSLSGGSIGITLAVIFGNAGSGLGLFVIGRQTAIALVKRLDRKRSGNQQQPHYQRRISAPLAWRRTLNESEHE